MDRFPRGGRHLWCRAPADNLRQSLDPHGIAWQGDIKARCPTGISPRATTSKGSYRATRGDPANPGRMPEWLAHEVVRVASPRGCRLPPVRLRLRPGSKDGRGPAAYDHPRDKLKRNVVLLCELPMGRPGRPSKALTLEQAQAALSAAALARPWLRAYIILSLLVGVQVEVHRRVQVNVQMINLGWGAGVIPFLVVRPIIARLRGPSMAVIDSSRL